MSMSCLLSWWLMSWQLIGRKEQGFEAIRCQSMKRVLIWIDHVGPGPELDNIWTNVSIVSEFAIFSLFIILVLTSNDNFAMSIFYHTLIKCILGWEKSDSDYMFVAKFGEYWVYNTIIHDDSIKTFKGVGGLSAELECYWIWGYWEHQNPPKTYLDSRPTYV